MEKEKKPEGKERKRRRESFRVEERRKKKRMGNVNWVEERDDVKRGGWRRRRNAESQLQEPSEPK